MDQQKNDYHFRFGGIARLYGQAGLERLHRSHVCVIGIGGVGSWTAEALARSAVGKLTLVDLDDICISNTNRQIHAMDGSVGKPKIEVMAERIRAINPCCEITLKHCFVNQQNIPEMLDGGFDFVVDAIDNAKVKCLLISEAKKRKIPILTVGGAGGRINPDMIRTDDLARAYNDRLLQQVRKRLRQKHGFPRQDKGRMRVTCVFSPEDVRYPGADGTVCRERLEAGSLKLDCAGGFGTATFVTGTFGFAAAAKVVNRLVAKE